MSYLTSSSARVYWSNFPLSPFVSYYLVRYKEVSNGFSRLFQVSRYSNTHYTSLLKAYTAYDIQVFAVTKSIGNVTYASKTVSIQTQEGGMSLRFYHVLSPVCFSGVVLHGG